MVNIWPSIPAPCLCDKHLNAAINEGLNLLIRYHMAKNHRVTGWIKNGCFHPGLLQYRIEELITESKKRGKEWSYEFCDSDRKIIDKYWAGDIGESIIDIPDLLLDNYVAASKNMDKLAERCGKCKERMEKKLYDD